MSCRSTKGGTATLRFIRRELGISDTEATALFHSLKREGCEVEEPTEAQIDEWRMRLRAQLESVDETEHQKARSERDLLATRGEKYDGPTFYALNMIEARARHEQVINKMKENCSTLDEPGAQQHLYELDENGRPTKVWYASYGSNIDENRFHTYIEGGMYKEGQIYHSGARDKELPEDETGVLIPGRLVFAARSGRWGGGGIAFVDVDNDEAVSAGRAYRIQWNQFEDVLSQESGGSSGTKTVEWSTLYKNGEYESSGLYGRVVHIGDLHGAPVLTFTGDYDSFSLASGAFDDKPGYRSLNKPHGNYVRTIGRGLESTFNLSKEEQADYIRGALGGHYYDREMIVETLNTPFEKVERTYYSRKSASSTSERQRGLSDRWNTLWPPERDYVPWWEDTKDPVNRSTGSHRDDEIPDWWWEEEMNSDDYEMQRWLDSNYTGEEAESTPMAFRNWDNPNYEPEYRANKTCVICYSPKHDMHGCPYLS